MKVLSVHLENFRNVESASVDLSADRVFFQGMNGQGKTNFLESVALLTALRSFRTHHSAHLIREGASEAGLYFRIDHEKEGPAEVMLRLKRNGTKSLEVDGEKVDRFSDFVGRFPVVVMSSDDMQILKGSPSLRRRFLDVTLSSVDIGYFISLRRYTRVVQERNLLLKQGASLSELSAFEKVLKQEARLLFQKREHFLKEFSVRFERFYRDLSQCTSESVACLYQPSVCLQKSEDSERWLESSRAQDLLFKATQKGPHRDDFLMLINEREAKDFASEGQKRSLVLALRLAQRSFFEDCLGANPVLLADDVLGELDPVRCEQFWKLLPADTQVVATGTRFPESDPNAWSHYLVSEGAFNLQTTPLAETLTV